MNTVYRTWAEVHLDALADNINQIKSMLSPGTRFMAVVKADAYGHGVHEVSRTLAQNGVDYFGVAFLDEARQLRRNKITLPIQILGYTPVEQAMEIADLDLEPTVLNFSMAKAFSNAAQKRNKTCKIHVKVDTGMSRVGYAYGDDPETNRKTVDDIIDLARIPNIIIEGLFTHFACADALGSEMTAKQFERYTDLVGRLEARGLNIPIKHVCNSAAAMRFPNMHLDMARIGIAMYGLYPSGEMTHFMKLRPAMELKTNVTQIKTVPADSCVSYGATYKTTESTVIGTIPIGYADGYSRVLSGKAQVIAGGKRVPIIGTICMDQCMINLTGVNNINVEDEIVMFGKQGDTQVSIEEVASWIGTINYELVCVIGKRVPRVYMMDGRVAGIKSYLE